MHIGGYYMNGKFKEEDKTLAVEILKYLNLKSGRKFGITNCQTIRFMNERFRQNRNVEDYKKVIDFKCKEWIDTEFEKYLKPDTLFSKKFDNYLEQSDFKKEPIKEATGTCDIDGYKKMVDYLKTMEYEEYLKTDHWIHFRNETYKFFRNKCQVCGSKENINIHHKTYENRGRETFNDVICLCHECHEKFHGIKAKEN